MSFQGSDERHLEVKVGAMILVAIGLLVTFVLLLSDFSFKTKKELNVYFQNPGGLSPGAPVKVAGRKAGTISAMTFLGQSGPPDPATLKPALVKVVIKIEEELHDALRADAKFYITTKGVLGDPFLEVDPGISKQKYRENVPLFGVNPPRIDLFIADTYELIRGLNGLIERNAKNLDLLLGGSAKLVGAIGKFIESDAGVEMAELNQLTDNVNGLVDDSRDLVAGVKEKYVDNPDILKTFKSMRSLADTLNKEVNPLLADIRGALKSVESLSDTLGPEDKNRIKSAIKKLDNLATRTDKLAQRADRIMARIESGEGTVGQMIQDEEIYDDIKELIRDIKRHPWKLIWED
jgi:phospholipid/cholesterol/gamma-HCH transport system substrate-binding protein